MRAGSDRSQPRTRTRHGARSRSVVARRCGDEHAGGGRIEERDLHRVEEIGQRRADRVIDHVHAISDGLIRRGHAIRGRTRCVALVRQLPAHLVDGQACARRDAVDGGEARSRCVPISGRARVPARSRCGVSAVTVEATRRDVLEVRDGAGPRDEVLRRDHLLVTHRGVEGLARCALAVPARNLVVVELAGFAVRVGARSVAEGRVLWPETGVEHADDDVLAYRAGLRPEAVRPGESEKPRSRKRIDEILRVGRDGDHVLHGPELLSLRLGEDGREAVEHEVVVVKLVSTSDLPESLVMFAVEVADVLLNVGRSRVDLLALRRLRRRVAGNSALIDGGGLVEELNEVSASGRVVRARLRGRRRGETALSGCK